MRTANAATCGAVVYNAFDVSRLMCPKLIVSSIRTDRAVDNAQCGPPDGSDHPSGIRGFDEKPDIRAVDRLLSKHEADRTPVYCETVLFTAKGRKND
jgi:hypothetical protein